MLSLWPYRTRKHQQWPLAFLKHGSVNMAARWSWSLIKASWFVGRLTEEILKLLQVQHTSTSAYHQQCNSQAEVANKIIAKYQGSFVGSLSGTSDVRLQYFVS